MPIVPSNRLQSLGGYAFAEVDRLVGELEARGVKPIDFGVGDPLDPTPEVVREAAKLGIDKHACTGYPSYVGALAYRQAAAQWMKRRFGVDVDPATEICATLGSKEAIFNFPEAYLNPGDLVIIPTPGYPPMKRGTQFAEGVPYFTPLTEKNGFLLDFASIPADVARQAKIIWTNYPNSPTGRVAPLSYYKELVAWAKQYDILIAADEGCYIDIYYDQKPHSVLEVAKEGVVAFYSMSKRNNMTGYRVGWAVGDAQIIANFKKLKTNIDSGTPSFIQEAAIAALADESHVESMRQLYRKKRDTLLSALSDAGLEVHVPEATFYVWQKVPAGMNSVEFAKRLLADDLALVVTPGAWITDTAFDGTNPGDGYVRFALVPRLEQVEIAAEKIRRFLKF